jgi:murein DD-endopeptidase MepM/ murein hydrolase activator NlpD
LTLRYNNYLLDFKINMNYKYKPNFVIKEKKPTIKTPKLPKINIREGVRDLGWRILAIRGIIKSILVWFTAIPFYFFHQLRYVWSFVLNIIQVIAKLFSPNYRTKLKHQLHAQSRNSWSRFKLYFGYFWDALRYSYLILMVLSVSFGLKVLSSSSYVYKDSFLDKVVAKASYIRYDNSGISNIKKLAIENSYKELKYVAPYRKYKIQENQKIEQIAEKFELKKETIIYNNNLKPEDELKSGAELLIPWQDVYIYPTEEVIEVKKLAEIFKLDEKTLYSKNESLIDLEKGTFAKDALVYIPYKDTNQLVEFKKDLDQKKEVARLAKIEESYKKQQEEIKKRVAESNAKLGLGGNSEYVTTPSVKNISNISGNPASAPNSSDSNAGGLIWPARGSITRCIEYSHNGCDIANNSNPPIYAAGSGVVSEVYIYSVWGYGNAVVIDHGGGLKTLYAHMLDGSIAVSKGQAVSQGQVIGTMGSTGNSTGTHLHFEVKQNGVNQNPLAYLQ